MDAVLPNDIVNMVKEYLRSSVKTFADDAGNVHVCRFVDGVLHGLYEMYKNGELEITVEYQYGAANGVTREYAKGVLRVESMLQDGVLHGTIKCFGENGNVTLLENYRRGLRYGLSERWNSRGVLVYSGVFENEIPDGIHFARRQDGGTSTLVYSKGVLTRYCEGV